MTELQIFIFNSVLHLIVLIFFYKKFGWINLATLAFCFYTGSSMMSLFYYLTPFYAYVAVSSDYVASNPLSVIWLCLFNALICLTMRNIRFPKNVSYISFYDNRFINILEKIIVLILGIIVAFQLPSAIQNVSSSNLADLRNSTYETGALIKNNFLVSLLSRGFGQTKFLLLAIPAFKWLVYRRVSCLDYFALLLYVLHSICIVGSAISRAVIIFDMIQVFLLIVCFHSFFNLKILRRIVIIGIPALWIFYSFFSSVTEDRFGNSDDYGFGASTVANIRYMGEAQANFISCMYGKTSGNAWFYRTLPLYRRIMGLEYYGNKGTDKESNLLFLDKLHPYPNYVFYSVAGTWYFDMGPILPIILLFFINIIIAKHHNSKEQETLNFFSLMIALYWGYYVINGIFWGQYSSEAGNLMILYFILLYYILKRYPAIYICKK